MELYNIIDLYMMLNNFNFINKFYVYIKYN